MTVLSRSALRSFWERHPDSEQSNSEQSNSEHSISEHSISDQSSRDRCAVAQRADRGSPVQARLRCPDAGIVCGSRVAFNIEGNTYRLATEIYHPHRRIYIRFGGAHAEYDRTNAAEVCNMRNLKPIRTGARYESALARILASTHAEPGTPEGDEFKLLSDPVGLYEDRRHPIGEPERLASPERRLEDQGRPARCASNRISTRRPGSEPAFRTPRYLIQCPATAGRTTRPSHQPPRQPAPPG